MIEVIKHNYTLKELVDEIKTIKKNLDCEVWLEGVGDGRVKIVFQDKKLTLL